MFIILGPSESSSLHPKHMVYFEVKEKKFRVKPIPYKQVRQFYYHDVSLRDMKTLNPNDPNIETKIKSMLAKTINEMIESAQQKVRENNLVESNHNNDSGREDDIDNSRSIGDDNGTKQHFEVRNPEKVLIRVRVNYEGFSIFNPQRFGAQFVGKIANPQDVILLSKRAKAVTDKVSFYV